MMQRPGPKSQFSARLLVT
uniref:Uncharacterized protein n=1 Tax=Anguilla anguilla TaxID=7936 RepID=A0A0E9P9C1_ANGAN